MEKQTPNKEITQFFLDTQEAVHYALEFLKSMGSKLVGCVPKDFVEFYAVLTHNLDTSEVEHYFTKTVNPELPVIFVSETVNKVQSNFKTTTQESFERTESFCRDLPEISDFISSLLHHQAVKDFTLKIIGGLTKMTNSDNDDPEDLKTLIIDMQLMTAFLVHYRSSVVYLEKSEKQNGAGE